MDEEQRRSITELKQFSVCQLLDALGASCSVETAIIPVDPHYRICGRALTVECIPGDNLTVHHALHLAEPGDVIVVAGGADFDGALWGELMSISAQTRGAIGTIVDGPVRDPIEIRKLGYPVFCRGFDPRRANKQSYGRLNVPVGIGKLSISPKDVVVADANGVLAIPASRLHETIRLASQVVQLEKAIKGQILSGRTIFDIFNLKNHVTASDFRHEI